MRPETSLGVPGKAEAPVQPWVSGKVFVTIERVSMQTQRALSYFCLLRK